MKMVNVKNKLIVNLNDGKISNLSSSVEDMLHLTTIDLTLFEKMNILKYNMMSINIKTDKVNVTYLSSYFIKSHLLSILL